MKTHTNSFKEQIKTMGREIDSKITYTLNGVNVELGGEQLNSITPTYQGALLKSVMKELDIDSNVYIPEKTILNYQFGVKVNGKYEYINFGNYVVYKAEKQEDTNSYKLTCYDKMLYSMIDYESLDITYPISIRDYINAICDKLGLTFKNANSTFANYDKQIQNELYLDSSGNSLGYTFRDILDELSQVTASCICINENDELEIRYINDTNDTIDEEFLKDINVNFGERYGAINTIVLSRSGGSDNIYYPEILPENPFEFKISDNQIMNFNDRSDYLPDIYSKLNGLEFYINDFSSTGICYYELLDRYNVKIGENTYSCIMLNDEINITQGLEEKIYTEIPEETKTDYTKADKTDRKINQTYLIVDKQNQVIESVVNQTTEQNQKISSITQTVDELNSKISDVIDITTSSESIYANVNLNNINTSEPIMIKIYPTTENISYLYPSDNLFPSYDLFPKTRTLRFIRTYNKDGIEYTENVDYELPDDLLYYDSETYDEFYLNYDSKTCQITKKCGYDENGKIYKLSNQIVIEYEYPKIELNYGDYEVKISGYNYGYIYVKLMISNNYTNQFATKVELSSEISQSTDNIMLKVNEKVNEDEIIAKINVAIEDGQGIINLIGNQVTIDSDNFKLSSNGTVEAHNGYFSGTINATDGNFEGTINTDKDLRVGNNAYIGQNQNSSADIVKYLYFSENAYIRRWIYSSGKNYIAMYSDLNTRLSCKDTGYINVMEDSIGMSHTPSISSDKRLKKNINDVDVSWINNIKIKEFEYKNTPNRKQIGVIAQDYLEEDYAKYFLNSYINIDGEKYYSVEYGNITNALIKYCQQLNKRIEDLENKIKEMEEK